MTETSRVSALPVTRPPGCPFDPPAAYATLRATEPVVEVRCPTGIDAWLVTRYADVRAVLADRTMSSRGAASLHILPNAGRDPVQPGSVIQLDGKDHSRLRKMVIAEFTVRRVEAMRDYVQAVVDSHLDAMLAQPGSADLVRDFASPITLLMISELLGVPPGYRRQFQRMSTTLLSSDTTPAETQQATIGLLTYLAELFADKQINPQDDVFSRMIVRGEADNDPLTIAEMAMLALNLVVAGHEATANMIALSTLALLEHPAQRDVLLEAPQRAIDELLRYLSVVQFGVLRYATTDVLVGERMVKAGEWLVAALNSANHDEQVFPHADDMDLSRAASRSHVAFGFGAHKCLGEQFARVELQEALTLLFRRVPSLRLAVPREELEYKDNTLVYGVRRLPVAWDEPAEIPSGTTDPGELMPFPQADRLAADN
ncbi:cytochrome P450 [Nocardia sp. NPDC051052]|uniref:cytochrome P450 n=1 Tax=Nocardia sp. NPDC051052 TaxID=3364322 RepID=UPI00378D8882